MTSRTAIHEAAHAVICLVLRVPVLSARVGPDGGRVNIGVVAPDDGPLFGAIVAAAAGAQAAGKESPGDLALMRRCAGHLRYMRPQQDELIGRARRYAARLLARPRVARAVAAVARELDRRGEMTAAEIVAVVREELADG